MRRHEGREVPRRGPGGAVGAQPWKMENDLSPAARTLDQGVLELILQPSVTAGDIGWHGHQRNSDQAEGVAEFDQRRLVVRKLADVGAHGGARVVEDHERRHGEASFVVHRLGGSRVDADEADEQRRFVFQVEPESGFQARDVTDRRAGQGSRRQGEVQTAGSRRHGHRDVVGPRRIERQHSAGRIVDPEADSRESFRPQEEPRTRRSARAPHQEANGQRLVVASQDDGLVAVEGDPGAQGHARRQPPAIRIEVGDQDRAGRHGAERMLRGRGVQPAVAVVIRVQLVVGHDPALNR